jgi:hypothetical protein
LASTFYKTGEDFLAVVDKKSEASILNTVAGSDGSNFSIRTKKQGVIVRSSTGNDSYNPLYSYSGKSPL